MDNYSVSSGDTVIDPDAYFDDFPFNSETDDENDGVGNDSESNDGEGNEFISARTLIIRMYDTNQHTQELSVGNWDQRWLEQMR
jgi:hypothetical protein